MRNWIKRVVGILGLILMIGMNLKLTLPAFQESLASRSWPVVSGEVIKSQVNSRAGKKKNQYQLEFEYGYEVGGKAYKGKSRFFSFKEPLASWIGNRFAFVKEHSVGSSIDVFYNPTKPERATIEKGLGLRNWLLLLIGVFFVLMMLHLIIFPEKWR